MDRRDFAIGILSTTSIILLVGLVVIHSRPAPVQADGMTVRVGEYNMTVGALNQVNEDIVYVVDGAAQKMIAYRFDVTTKEIEILSGIDLAPIRDARARP